MVSFKEEIGRIVTSELFDKWIFDILKDRYTGVISKELLINGYCEDLAVYMKTLFSDVQIVEFNMSIRLPYVYNGHIAMIYQGKYYDGYTTTGVDKFSNLHWSEKLMNDNRKIDAEFIDSNVMKHKIDPWYRNYTKQLKQLV